LGAWAKSDPFQNQGFLNGFAELVRNPEQKQKLVSLIQERRGQYKNEKVLALTDEFLAVLSDKSVSASQ